MTVLTKHVNIENEEFVLIKGEHEDRTFYGTIPYSEIDEHGRMKRELNGVELRIVFTKPADAIEERRCAILF